MPRDATSPNRYRTAAPFLRLVIMLVAALAASACGDDPPEAADGAARPGLSRLDDVVRWEREFTLEENEETINVIVRAGLDPRGGFLIADEQEGFARRYDENGRLLAQFAGKGNGPAEFMNLLNVTRLPDGSLAAFDIFQKIAIFDSAGSEVVRTARTPLAALHSVVLLNDSIALLGGSVPGPSGVRDSRVHRWNVNGDSLEASFFAPALPSRAHVMAAGSAGWIGMDRRADTLAVVFALSDTVYLMTAGGAMVDRIAIPAEGFRRLSPDIEMPGRGGGILAAREWFASFSLVSHVFWLGDTLLVQYQDRNGPEPDWRLVGLTRTGQRIFEVMDSPQLLAVDHSSGLLYFESPDSDLPNVWRAARLVEQ